MYLVDEALAASLVTIEDAINVVENAFRALARGEASTFPVVMGETGSHGEIVGLKGGLIGHEPGGLIGLKVGSYWPDNPRRGLAAHGSTTLLLDRETGFPRALVAASTLNSLRTSASSGVAIRRLARADSTSLALLGAGHQAWHELLAVRAVRPIDRVRIWNRTAAGAETLARRVHDELGLDAEASDAQDAVRSADIVVTVTAATAALFEADWISPGTHISAMGADGPGKQELPVALVERGRCFADIVDQSISVGEFEAAHKAGLLSREGITPIGSVLNNLALGRLRDDDITIFDSSGTALQDLAIADLALRRAIDRNLAHTTGHFHPLA